MFIRKTTTRTLNDGTTYHTFRLVHNVRIQDRIKQETLLNLGSKFRVDPSDWGTLCARIEELLSGQASLMPPLSNELEATASGIVEQLLSKQALQLRKAGLAQPLDATWYLVDVASTRLREVRSVGVEHVGLWALLQLGIPSLLAQLGCTIKTQHALLGAIVGRLAKPGSERATYTWLCNESGLGEFLGGSFQRMSLMQLYRASDQLVTHRDEIESKVFHQARSLFDLDCRVTLFDLTNTYLEGSATAQTRAKHGKSKEKRSDCPLITLALVLDGSGFVRRSKIYAGNVAEMATLSEMLTEVEAPKGAIVVMDRGIASEQNVNWLRESGYAYLVVSREQTRVFDPQDRTITQLNEELELYEVRDPEQVRVYCRSRKRKQKEEAMVARYRADFEAQLQQLNQGLSKPKTWKKLHLVHQRLGRIQKSSRGIWQHYEIEVVADPKGLNAVEVKWTPRPQPNSMWTDPGTYCLKTNVMDLTTAQLWQTYIMLTDLEAVFRSLKSELGLRPIFHQTDRRTEGHLFITVLAYQVVQVVRTVLRQKGITWSWNTIRNILSFQRRATTTQTLKEGGAVHTRVTSDPEADQREIYQALGIPPRPLVTEITLT